MKYTDKEKIFNLVKESLHQDLTITADEMQRVREVAISTDSKADEDDAGNVEAAYLESAQSKRLAEIQQASQVLNNVHLRKFSKRDGVSVTALVQLQWDDRDFFYFILPQSGGLKVSYQDCEVRLVTPQSPLGKELLGKKIGDSIEVGTPNSVRAYEVVSVL
jgi:transcription elongation GreA/GreB family factor